MNRSEISKFPTTDLTECCIDNYIPDDRGILLEEIQIKYRMNESSVKWIENNNIGEENPLLVLSILDDRYLQYKDRIHASLIANNAEKIGDICYQFETLGTLWKANKALRKDVIEVIYSRDPLIQSVLAAQIYLFKYWSNN
uniref:Uncharacterized protein n=1 Tax=Panagrolaimus sp. PS1159 TaxID=55785 RepID=A0AC35FUG7_9BILA